MLHLSDLAPGDHHQLRADLRSAMVGGVMAALVMGAIVLAVGGVNSSEARSLLEASLPTTRAVAGSVMRVTATTLALMLTLLGVSAGTERKIKGTHYERIRQIALVDVAAFVGGTVLLVVLVVPLNDATEIPSGWYVGIYYTTALLASVLGGTLVSVMILLYTAVRDLITVMLSDEDSPLIASEEDAPEAA